MILNRVRTPIIWLLLFAFFLLFPPAALAQDAPAVQVLTGRLEPGELAYYRLPGLTAGDTVYIYASAASGNLDPIVGLLEAGANLRFIEEAYREALSGAIAAGNDPLAAAEEIRNEFLLAWDDDSSGTLAAGLEFAVPQDGDYLVLVGSSLSALGRETFGDYRLLVGLNAPDVLGGEALPTGAELAFYDETANLPRRGVEVVTGSLVEGRLSTSYPLQDLRAGDTLYAYLEATSGDLKPVLLLRNYAQKPLRSGNVTGEAATASLEYTLPQDLEGFSLEVAGGLPGGPSTLGDYRLVVGVNAPEASSGEAEEGGIDVLREPIDVQIGAKLQQIIGVNQADENVNVVATIQMDWADPLLAYSPDECRCSVKVFTEKEFDRFLAEVEGRWPDFTLANQQGNRWTQNRVALIHPDGSASYLERFTTNLQLDFDFRKFPFDTQEFLLNVDLLYPEEFYLFTDLEGFSEISQEHGEDEFIITDFDTEVSSVQSSTQSLTSRFTLFFFAPRHLEYYILQIFLPIGLIIAVSWLTFFLKDYTKRIEVAAGNLLLFIAFSFSIADNYPRLGYLTMMDVIMSVTFLVNALVVMYNVYMRRLEMNEQEDLADRIDRYADWVYPFAYIVPFGIVILVYF